MRLTISFAIPMISSAAIRHVPFALALRIVRERLQVLWTNVPVADRVERILRGCREEQRIAAHVLLVLLPLFDGLDLGLQDESDASEWRETSRMKTSQASSVCLISRSQSSPPRMRLSTAKVGQALRDRRLKVAGDER